MAGRRARVPGGVGHAARGPLSKVNGAEDAGVGCSVTLVTPLTAAETGKTGSLPSVSMIQRQIRPRSGRIPLTILLLGRQLGHFAHATRGSGLTNPRPAHAPRPRRLDRTGASEATIRGPAGTSEVAAALLLALDGLEERLEVALAEAERAVPLDQLEEDRRAGRRAAG